MRAPAAPPHSDPTPHTQAFTLAEILVALLVVVTVSAMLYPSYVTAQRRPFDLSALECGRAIIDAQVIHKASRGTFYAGGFQGLGPDVTAKCTVRDVQIQSYVAGFNPNPGIGGNAVIGGNGEHYNFWVWSLGGSTSYYTSTWDHLRLSVSTQW